MKRTVTAREIYDELMNNDRITTLAGLIEFRMGDVSIRVKRKDVVGNILQEWLQGWFNRIFFLALRTQRGGFLRSKRSTVRLIRDST